MILFYRFRLLRTPCVFTRLQNESRQMNVHVCLNFEINRNRNQRNRIMEIFKKSSTCVYKFQHLLRIILQSLKQISILLIGLIEKKIRIVSLIHAIHSFFLFFFSSKRKYSEMDGKFNFY